MDHTMKPTYFMQLIERGIKLYHSSGEVFPSNKPEFDAFYGGEQFIKDFPNEFGQHLYQITLPASARVLDLNIGSPEARQFKAEMAQITWPDDTEFAEMLLAGDPEANNDFYDTWTDKHTTLRVMQKHPEYAAVRYQDEYVVPASTTSKLVGKKLRG